MCQQQMRGLIRGHRWWHLARRSCDRKALEAGRRRRIWNLFELVLGGLEFLGHLEFVVVHLAKRLDLLVLVERVRRQPLLERPAGPTLPSFLKIPPRWVLEAYLERWSISTKSLSLMFMSLTGSSSGTPLGKRRWTSRMRRYTFAPKRIGQRWGTAKRELGKNSVKRRPNLHAVVGGPQVVVEVEAHRRDLVDEVQVARHDAHLTVLVLAARLQRRHHLPPHPSRSSSVQLA